MTWLRGHPGGVQGAEQAGRGVPSEADADGPVTIAVSEDTCGNLIQLAQS
jgi:hypothetical protein